MSKLSEELIHLAPSTSKNSLKKFEATIAEIARQKSIDPDGCITVSIRHDVERVLVNAISRAMQHSSIEDVAYQNFQPTPNEIED